MYTIKFMEVRQWNYFSGLIIPVKVYYVWKYSVVDIEWALTLPVILIHYIMWYLSEPVRRSYETHGHICAICMRSTKLNLSNVLIKTLMSCGYILIARRFGVKWFIFHSKTLIVKHFHQNVISFLSDTKCRKILISKQFCSNINVLSTCHCPFCVISSPKIPF